MPKDNFLYKGIDLRTATVFDLTDDKEFLARFLTPELGINTKEEYLALGENTPLSRASDMLEFAEEKKLNSLVKQLNEIYKDDLALFFNE